MKAKSLIDSSTGWPLRSHLILYGLSIVVPVLIFAGLLFVQFERSERTRLEERVREVASNVAVDVDREIDNIIATLAALAASPSLQTGDLPAFREQARKVLRATGSNIVLRDLTGQQLVNTRVAPEAVLPKVGPLDVDRKVLETRQPVISDLMVGAVSKAPVMIVNVPVFSGDDIVYLLNMGLEPTRFSDVIAREILPPEWVVAVADTSRTIVARSRLHDEFVGKAVPPRYYPLLSNTQVWQDMDLEGRTVMGATVRSERHGWTIWAAVPTAALTAPLRETLIVFAVAGSLLTGLSLLLAMLFGRRLAAPVRALASQAALMAQGKDVKPIMSPVREVNDVSSAMRDASDRLRDRSHALREAVDELEGLYETAPVGIALLDEHGKVLRINDWLAQVNGARASDHVGRAMWDVAPPLRPIVEPLVNEVFATAKPIANIEISGEVPSRPGEIRSYFAHYYPAKARDGKVSAVGVIVEDVTERKRAEDLARESNARLHRLLEANLFGMVTSADGIITEANEAFLDMIGATREDVEAGRLDWASMTPPEFQAADQHSLEELRERGSCKPFEKELIRRDGSRVPILIGAARLDRPNAAICFTIDLTERRQREAHQLYLMRELTHRTKNLLSVVQSMALQTARNLPNLDDFHRRFAARLQGLAGSHDLLVQEDWAGASMNDLVRSQLGHYADAIGGQVEVTGPLLLLTPEAAQNIGMALHELSTNAAKYGSLSVAEGKVRIAWRLETREGEQRLVLEWTERGGPPVTPPTRKGFGHVVMARIVARALEGTVDLDFAPEGLRWTLDIPATYARPSGIAGTPARDGTPQAVAPKDKPANADAAASG